MPASPCAARTSSSGTRVKGYVSLSTGGFYEDTVTAYVTFCAQHPDLPRYLGPIEGYEEEAVAEVVLGDFEE